MITPARALKTTLAVSNTESPEYERLSLKIGGATCHVPHDGFSLGSSPRCDLSIQDETVPALHSIVHRQAGAIWIETADEDKILIVNDQPCRRMALRHEDRIRIGATELVVLLQPAEIAVADTMPLSEDLALLTAEELCDRILAEQALIAEYDEGRRAGWEALLRAIDAAHEESDSEALQPADTLNDLLGQIQELNETITDRTREIEVREAEMLASNSALEETQQQVAERINEILEQLKSSDPPNEFRASA